MDESGRIEVMMEGLDRKLDLLLEGLNFLQGRAQRMEGELDRIQEDTACLPAMESAVKGLAPLVNDHEGRIRNLEKRVS